MPADPPPLHPTPLPVGPPAGVRTTRRRGRTSPAKEAALRDLGPRWALPAHGPWDPATLAARFGQGGPLLVDIGVGDGSATLTWAAARPEARILALELHRPGLAKLLTALDADGPANVRVSEADALRVVDDLAPGSVAAIRVLFPDPWPKRRHVARRLVDRAFVTAAADALETGGELHLATDWADYAAHMTTMIATERRLEAVGTEHRIARQPTSYERRGTDAGRTITDLVLRRR